MSRIDLGLIDGNYWNADHVNQVEAAINESSPAGVVQMTVAAVAPTGWLMLNGQVVPNAQTLYPDLWLVIPLAWKSGATMTLPNATSRFPIGGGAVGTVGGSSARVLAATNLPPHAHAINHDHASALSGGRNRGHTHKVSPDGFNPVGSVTPASSRQFVVQSVAGGPNAFDIAAGSGATIGNVAVTGDTSTESADHEHTFDVPAFAGNSGNGPGTAVAVDVTPAWIALNFMIRAF